MIAKNLLARLTDEDMGKPIVIDVILYNERVPDMVQTKRFEGIHVHKGKETIVLSVQAPDDEEWDQLEDSIGEDDDDGQGDMWGKLEA